MAKKVKGSVAKSQERDEPDMVKAHAENLKAAKVKATLIETRRAQLPPNER